MNNKSLLIAIICLQKAFFAYSIGCNHDEIQSQILTKGDQNYAFARRAVDYAPIRIVFDLSYLTGISESQQSSISSLLEYVKLRLSTALQVVPISGNLLVPQTCTYYYLSPPEFAGKCRSAAAATSCLEVAKIPEEYMAPITLTNSYGQSSVVGGGTGVPNADLLIFVTAVNTSSCGSSTLAYASACQLDQNDRPIVGGINFCIQNNLFTTLQPATQREVLLHECIHVLGFSSYLFSFYRNENGQPRTPRCPGASGCTSDDIPGFPPLDPITGSYAVSTSTVTLVGSIQYVVTPAVAAVARAYFDCPALPGAPLENHGSMDTAGSHWKLKELFTEVMNGEIDPDFTPVLSEFTLAIFADTGWYQVNYSAADSDPPMLWGRGTGCSILGTSCLPASTFCSSPNGVGCLFDRSAIGYCGYLDSLMDNCNTYMPYDNRMCNNREGLTTDVTYVGPDSACFSSTVGPGSRRKSATPASGQLCTPAISNTRAAVAALPFQVSMP